MFDKVDESLSTLVGESRDAAGQSLLLETRGKLLAQRKNFEDQFRTRYLAQFQKRSNRVKKIGESFSEIDLSSMELELVGDDDLNETLRFNDIAAKVREYCEEELGALDQRAGVLLGDASLQAEDNPFTPQAICDAYKYSCRQFDSNVEVRMILLQLFDDHVLDEIRAMYKSVNALLVQNSILPKIRRAPSTRKNRDKKAASGSEAEAQTPGAAANAAEPVAGSGQDFFSLLQNLLVSNLQQLGIGNVQGTPGAPAQGVTLFPNTSLPSGAGAEGVPRAVVLQGPELLGSLTRIQHGDIGAVPGMLLPQGGVNDPPGITNVLHELKSSSLGNGMNRLDIMTLDIVAMLFDALFDDPRIPAVVKGLIGRLQIPMLKVAISDKSLFSRKSHPARQLLDALGEISSRLPVEFNTSDPLFAQLQGVVGGLLEGFEEDLGIFDTAREKIQSLIVEGDREAKKQTQTAAVESDQKESLALAKTVAQAEIKVRIRFSKLPAQVLAFLVQQWIKFMMVVHVRDGEQSEAWKQALDTMDRLIWSVEPKTTVEQRRELAQGMPDLLRRLTAGLKDAGIGDDVRLGFFADLRKLHSEIIDKGAKTKLAATEDSKLTTSLPAPQPSPPEMQILPDPQSAAKSAETPAAPMEAETVKPEMPEFETAISVNNPFGGGEVQVDDLDFTVVIKSGVANARGDQHEGIPLDLKEGVSVRFIAPGKKDSGRSARLSYISPLKTRYLFVDRQGKTVLECSASQLAIHYRNAEIVVEDAKPETPLFDRIMGGVVDKLSGSAAPSSAGRPVGKPQ